MILYTENPSNSAIKLYKHTNSSKFQDSKSVALSHPNYESSEKEIKETILSPIATDTENWMKFQGISLTKGTRTLCNENYKLLVKEIEKDTKKWNDILCSWLKDSTSLKCPW